eukprot:Gregarina_sp_Poly_1__3981@NODE_21_length_20913_cov_102_783268_g19_i0_p16_GENE_NODE_21_length_20913_cov_102_783268_g19_i0NODE_21_length_20913_cov_102_783268_g19_i0_p16_ORF_typecomplete_len151_score14_50PAP2/PF01569_21/7_7e20PAP2_3/PF14378_6/1_8e05LtrA/PF06772_11/0_0017ArAE_2_N/PF10337_9/0_0036DUF3147/PF11345_8/0_018DUF63/PF01889_17/0_016Cytomega_TRL10/PF06084_11/0_044Polysacc_synt/PF01943_17/0_045PTPS_related/PF10131_9/0_097DUF4131/PF13567_6/0_12TcpE/PF12648_7/0_34TcpE/PF12648_7/4_1e03_NODE_21_le
MYFACLVTCLHFQTDDPLTCPETPYSLATIEDGRMSFPSEHSATAFSIFTFMALWNLERIKSIEGYGAQALVFPLIVLLIPLIIAVTRTSDYRHHAADVLAGISLGACIAVAVFWLYFPRKHHRPQPGFIGSVESEESQMDFEEEYGTHA